MAKMHDMVEGPIWLSSLLRESPSFRRHFFYPRKARENQLFWAHDAIVHKMNNVESLS